MFVKTSCTFRTAYLKSAAAAQLVGGRRLAKVQLFAPSVKLMMMAFLVQCFVMGRALAARLRPMTIIVSIQAWLL